MPSKTSFAPQKICILGSTGSIGMQALQVIDENPAFFRLEVLTANDNADLLIRQALQYKPATVVIANEDHYKKISDALRQEDIKVFAGSKSIEQIVHSAGIDIVLVAIVGFAAMRPTIEAIYARKRIAIANKESLVVAGHIISPLVIKNRVEMIPVDSEHSAIFQSLSGENPERIKKLILTASGGPFRHTSIEHLQNIQVKDALQHPNWTMGDKITIDSASMMNKGLEVIEAKWLFGVDIDRIEVVIHPESIIHSLVHFVDGSIKAQLSNPDMRYPIQYAFTYPDRLPNNIQHFDFQQYKKLSFEKPDVQIFRNLALAFEAGKRGGNAPCILNAANEAAVEAFLSQKIKFLDLPKVVEKTMEKITFDKNPDLTALEECHRESIRKANEIINKLKV
jgi:1-deoxy-D-xylulose-5-phosphate reductoisomerase